MTPDAVQNLMATVHPALNILSVQWTDTQANFSYQISYSVSARTVLLFTSGDMAVTNAEAKIGGTNDSFMYNITDMMTSMYFVEGVSVVVSVAAVNGSMVGPAVMNTTVAPGSKLSLSYTHSLTLFLSLSLSL